MKVSWGRIDRGARSYTPAGDGDAMWGVEAGLDNDYTVIRGTPEDNVVRETSLFYTDI